MQPKPSPGDLSFDTLAEIAVGATASVELCRVTEGPLDGELVAVKRLHLHIAEDPQFVDMFRDEVWMTSALKHKHVVQVVGWGHDGDGPFLAVEFVRGVSLARLMKTVFETGEIFTERMVVFLGACVCDGLSAAHSLRSAEGEHLNLVHRDVTPGNVLTSFGGDVKITDFGLAKAKQRLTKTLTGLLKGQPQYMSPEQIQAKHLDGRSDIFAMGVVLFELFTGQRPWSASSELDAMRATSENPPADLLQYRPKIDKALVEIVYRCLEKDPAARFQSAHDLRDRLNQWLAVHGYRDDNQDSLARFVRRNAMRQMRWFERAVAGEFKRKPKPQQTERIPRPRSGEQTSVETPSKHRLPEPDLSDSELELLDDSIDWGDDGPTLIKKAGKAKEAIARAARRAKEARERAAAAKSSASEQISQHPHAPAIAPKPTEVSAESGSEVPGVVAPPDPSAPPPPVMGAGEATEVLPPPYSTGTLAAAAAKPAEAQESIEARASRLASEATSAAQAARRSADIADAAAHAALLASEALRLSRLGDERGARSKLGEAEQIDESLKRGEIPGGLAKLGGMPLMPSTHDRWQILITQLQTREGLLLVVVVGCILLAVIVLVALLVS